jgi:hypothetical protein
LIHTQELSSDYAFCQKVRNQRDVVRLPIREVTLKNYVALSPEDYAIFMEWLNDMRRNPDAINQ